MWNCTKIQKVKQNDFALSTVAMSDTFTVKKTPVERDTSGLGPNTLRPALSHIYLQQ